MNICVGVGQNLPYNHAHAGLDGADRRRRCPAFPQAVDDYQFLSRSTIADVSDAPRQGGRWSAPGSYYLRNINGHRRGGRRLAEVHRRLDVRLARGRRRRRRRRPRGRGATREGYSFEWDTDSPACGTRASGGPRATTSGAPATTTPTHGRRARRAASRVARDGDRLPGSRWKAPGDDWLCGQAARYQVRASNGPIDSPADGTEVGTGFDADEAADANVTRDVALPAGTTHVAVLYRDDAGNWGHLASVQLPGRRRRAADGGGSGAGGTAARRTRQRFAKPRLKLKLTLPRGPHPRRAAAAPAGRCGSRSTGADRRLVAPRPLPRRRSARFLDRPAAAHAGSTATATRGPSHSTGRRCRCG